MKCLRAPELVRKEMRDYLKKNSRTVFVDTSEQGQEDANEEEQAAEAEPSAVPSSRTKIKQAKKKIA